ncbi:hypothetical protein ACE6H2_020181 [Prunus campanulata]
MGMLPCTPTQVGGSGGDGGGGGGNGVAIGGSGGEHSASVVKEVEEVVVVRVSVQEGFCFPDSKCHAGGLFWSSRMRTCSYGEQRRHLPNESRGLGPTPTLLTCSNRM